MSYIGEVKMFDHNKGYGFLCRVGGYSEWPGERDVFVHVSALEAAGIATVAKGDRLRFEIKLDSKRQDRSHATNLQLLDDDVGSH
jgi:CspA family cold shock protein